MRGPAFSNVWPVSACCGLRGPDHQLSSQKITLQETFKETGETGSGGGKHSTRKPEAPHSPVHLHSLQSQPHTLTQCLELPTTPISHDCPGPGTWDLSGLPCPEFLCAILVSLYCYNKLLRSRSIKQQKFFLRALKAGKRRIREPGQSGSVRVLLLARRQRLLTVPSHSEGKGRAG